MQHAVGLSVGLSMFPDSAIYNAEGGFAAVLSTTGFLV